MFLSKNKVICLLVISFTGWVFAGYLSIIVSKSDIENAKIDAANNAFNMVYRVLELRNKTTDEDIINEVMLWFENGWTAQTGSLKTLCKFNNEKLDAIMSLDEKATVCRLTM